MADTTHLQLPLLAAAQAQKHVTHNDALLRLDALMQTSVIDRDLTEPPADPSDGDRYIPASGATGAWADWDLNIAWYVDGVWTKLVPREGWRVWLDDEDVLIVWDGAAWQQIEGGGGGREVLTADRTYFVRTDGDDGNDGLSDTAEGAFATLQKAIDTVGGLDVGIHDVTIEVADGTYSATNRIRNFVGAGRCTIQGSSSAVVTAASGNVFYTPGVTSLWTVKGIKVEAPAGSCFYTERNSLLTLDGITFGSTSAAHVLSADGSTTFLTGAYTIAGNAAWHWYASFGGLVITFDVGTITLTGTPSFATSFAFLPAAGAMRVVGLTFSGSATGKRFTCNGNSVLQTGGAAGYLPGDVAGTTATGGQYF